VDRILAVNGLSDDGPRGGSRDSSRSTALSEPESSRIGTAYTLTTILHMWRRTRAIEFVPSEWETAVCGSDTLHIRYTPSELICQRGSYVAGIHLMLSGVASQSLQPLTRSPNRPDLLGAGDLIGIEALAESTCETSRSGCLAITDVELLFFERQAFTSHLLRNPALSHRLLRYLAARHMNPQGDVRHGGSDSQALSELLLRLDDLCGGADRPDLGMLPRGIALRTLQELVGLTGRRFRNAWNAVDTLEIADSQIVFRRDALLRSPVQLSNSIPPTRESPG